jgi:hypothetical protein
VDLFLILFLYHNDDHLDEVRLCSELRPPTGLLFVLQVIYEHGETWWNYIDRGELLIRPPELSGNFTSSHLVENQEELAKKVLNFVGEVFLSYVEVFFNMP